MKTRLTAYQCDEMTITVYFIFKEILTWANRYTVTFDIVNENGFK